MSISTEPTAPSTNGELIDRVQQLRLAGQLGVKGGGSGRGAWLPWVLCAMMAVTWAGVGVRSYKAAEAGGDTAGAAKGAPAAGAAPASGAQQASNHPSAEPGALLFPIKGTLTPFLQINLSPDDVTGTVIDIYFKEGDRVKKGQKLATIRNDHYLNDWNATKAALEAAQFHLDEMLPASVRQIEKDQAEAEWAEAEANRVRAEKALERLRLGKSGVISKQDLENAEADLDSAIARAKRLAKAKTILDEGPRPEKVKAARADVATALARYVEADRLLKNCTVVSPIDGTILTKVADKGVLVLPLSYSGATGICSIADLSDLEAEIEVREDQITQIQLGLRCEVVATADPSRVYKGRIDRIMPIADDTKNVIKVRVKVQLPPGEEPGSFLKPKMSTTVRVYNAVIPEFTAPPSPKN
jgi:HlyD family secretion protein